MTKYTLESAAQEIADTTNPVDAAFASTATVDRHDHVAAAAYLMRHHGVSALSVLDGDRFSRPIGMITVTDIRQAAAEGKDLDEVRVQQLMSPSAGRNQLAASTHDTARTTGKKAVSAAGH